MAMSHTLKNRLCNLPPGTVVTGKWHGRSYRLLRRLGSGANGVVYLAESGCNRVAVKLSDDYASLASEMNILRRFSKVQGGALGPSLLEADDWRSPLVQETIPFYVMEYIEGENFTTFVRRRGKEWAPVLLVQLLSVLERLHEEGWVFGDLKPDNLIVTGPPPSVRLLDVGGTTLQGRAVKEFTELYDRGYWGLGSRKAEPSYDLFSAAMVMIASCYSGHLEKKGDGRSQLFRIIEADRFLAQYKHVLQKALDGRYAKAADMRRDLLAASSRRLAVKDETKIVSSNRRSGRRAKKRRKVGAIAETVLIAVLLLGAYGFYIYWQLTM
ncbi:MULTISPECIES: protein kinase domain-containing protein [Geobacillus]|jgi:serine/threonine protein kinase, bacterial|uniref:Serine/threonine-protein kinase n=2 Tax=Geobacillus thermodenitrificans TaxID=33940 RepID=A4IJE2_GEOTN|nr:MULTISPECIES: serine/threonine protein kinase [Geobacillus]ABO65446.1 Serine/threonine-protein kinase [Geobacillus thermodenitrificans NG80-2]ARP41079.1 putative serine/threonine-protein kinase [Geobacillus thermodenitrificans]ATO37461.1 serine/threonine protein kinase [Geobacillus thermodenitrificans]MEC5189644.1 serine/threonine-protein kinase [Geobacillus thermodenitrificans]MED0664646.1 serine/threonine protein kinase [Geobacillus thermodenitrificans]